MALHHKLKESIGLKESNNKSTKNNGDSVSDSRVKSRLFERKKPTERSLKSGQRPAEIRKNVRQVFWMRKYRFRDFQIIKEKPDSGS